jgi:quinol monooxygenase YgiN
MAEIRAGRHVVTLINVFTVAPERQQQLLDVLIEATEAVMRHQLGFVSANIHRGLDGAHVANYAQWRSRADFEAMLADPAAQAHLARARALATAEGHLYEVVATHEAPQALNGSPFQAAYGDLMVRFLRKSATSGGHAAGLRATR